MMLEIEMKMGLEEPAEVGRNVDGDVVLTSCGRRWRWRWRCLCPDHRRINQLCALLLPSMIQNHAKVRVAVAIAIATAFGFAFVSSSCVAFFLVLFLFFFFSSAWAWSCNQLRGFINHANTNRNGAPNTEH